MELTKDTVGMWYLQLDNVTDWLCHLSKSEDGAYTFEGRIRHYDKENPDNDAFSKKDKKIWYEVPVFVKNPTVALHLARRIVTVLERKSGNKAIELLMKDGDVDGFMDRLAAQPWAHIKKLPMSQGKRMRKARDRRCFTAPLSHCGDSQPQGGRGNSNDMSP